MIEREKLKVLIVEDDRTSRMLATESLSDYKEAILEKLLATDASSGMEKFSHEHPDITFLDINLPGGNGLHMLPLMLRQNPEAFIVMMTSSADERDVHAAKAHGAMGYILKPFNMKRFKDAVKAFILYREALGALPEEKRRIPDNIGVTREEVQFLFDAQIEEEDEQQEINLNDIIAHWNVMFVDDYLANREHAQHHLSKFGCKNITLVESGEEALKKLKEKDYQLVFIDTNMPDLDGYQVTLEYRHHEKDKQKEKQNIHRTYIIAMLNSTDEVDTQKWLKAGMNDLLIKPCKFHDLEDKMHKYARQYRRDNKEKFVS